MYQKWNCTEHGNYKFEEKYRVRCVQCFSEMKKELVVTKKISNDNYSKYIKAMSEIERYEALLQRRYWDFIKKTLRLKSKSYLGFELI